MTTLSFSLPVALIAASLWSGAAPAQSRAVSGVNFELRAAASDVDTSGSTSSGRLDLEVTGTVPLGRYLGASLSGAYAKTNVRTREILGDSANSPGQPGCGFDGTEADVALFARQPSLGRVGVSYGKGRLSSNCGNASIFFPTGNDELRTDHYRVDAEIYVRSFTLAAARTSTEIDGGSKQESTSWSTRWYPLESLRIEVSGDDLYGQDSYGVRLDHQPEFLGDTVGVHVGYSEVDRSPHTRTISVGVEYYFGARTSLKSRDREWR